MSSTQRYLGPLALSAMRGLVGNASVTSGGSRGGFARTMRGVGTIGCGEGKGQGPERSRGRGRGRGKERALETPGERGRDRSNSQRPGGIRDGESSGGGSNSGSRGGSGGRGSSGPRKSRGRGQGAFISFLEPHRRKTDIESRGGSDGRTGRKKFEKDERERKKGEYGGGDRDKRGSGGAARYQEFDDGDAYDEHTDEFNNDSFRVPRHLAVPRKVATLDGEFDPWHRIGGDEYEQGDIDSRTWDEKVAEAWKRSTDKDDPDWDESDEDFHKMSYHYFKNPAQKVTVNGPRGKYELPSRRARSVVDLLQEFDMPEKLDIKPGDSEYETLKDAWVVVSRNPSMSRRSKNRLIKQMARFLHKNRESTELFEEMELPTLEELRRRENRTYRENW